MKLVILTLLCMILSSCSNSIDKYPNNDVLDKLLSRYDVWQGTNYQIGGLSRNGIDCSGFVQLTFRDEFEIELPRTTHKQSQVGKTIHKKELMAGDLIFFNIPGQGKIYHVGIYLENQYFLHASTSVGVTISNLNNAYWVKNYWKSQRVN